MAEAVITGTFTVPGGGVRWRIIATPETTNGIVTLTTGARIGSVAVETNANGEMPTGGSAMTIPTDADIVAPAGEVLWRFQAVPLDKRAHEPSASPVALFVKPITGNTTIEALLNDQLAVVSVTASIIADVSADADRAEAAAAAAEAVGNTNDTIIAGRIDDPASATRASLSATYVPKVPGPALRYKNLPGLLDNRRFNNSMSQAQDPIVTVGNTQYAVWSNGDRKPFVGKRTLPDGAWTTYDLTSAGGLIGAATALDEHNAYSIAVDSAGHIHVSGNMHGDWLRYGRTTIAGDITSTVNATMTVVGSKTGTDEGLVSYPKFFTHPDGTLFFTYRNGGSGNADQYLNRYDTATQTWTRVCKLFDGITASESPYLDNVVVTDDGTIHVSYQWRPNGGSTADTNDLCYIRSTDKGVTWTSVTGAAVAVPITHAASPKVVDTAATGHGLQNSCGLSVDTDGNPHLVNFIDQGAVNWQTQHHYWNGAAWVTETITEWTTTAVSWTPRPRIISAANGRTYVLLTYRYEGWAGRVWLIDVTPGSPRYRFPIADLDLRDSELTFDSRALRDDNTLHVLLTPTNAAPGITENYWGDEQWNKQWGGVLTVDLDQIEQVANGHHTRPSIRTLTTVAAPQPTSVTATTAALLTNMPLLNTSPDLRGRLVMVRLVVQAIVTVDTTTMDLDIRELENGVGGNGRTWGSVTITNTASTAAGANQATPWMPLVYGPRVGKEAQLAVFGTKAGPGVGTLYVCTLELGVLDAPT